MSASPIYLDYAATAPLDSRVAEVMSRAWQQGYANPASQHQAGRRARRALEQAREEILAVLGGCTQGMNADRFIFTSGGTEANHLALLGLAGSAPSRILISAVEHPSVRGAAEMLRLRGHQVDQVRVTVNGLVDVTHLAELLQPDPTPRLVSIMLVNNETGVIQPFTEIAPLCRARDVLLHCDAVQAIGKLRVAFEQLGVDALTIAPHKFGGPIGIGGLLVRHALTLEPQLRGGFQQAGLRAGTESVPLALAFAAATRIAQTELPSHCTRLAEIQQKFESQLAAQCEPFTVNGCLAPRSGHVSNVAFLGLDRQQLFLALDVAGVLCSTGSACASGSSEPSPTLLAMGLPLEVVECSLRFSFGPEITLADVAESVERISKAVNKLRR